MLGVKIIIIIIIIIVVVVVIGLFQEAKKKCLEQRRIIQYNSDKRVVSQNECLEGEDLEKKIFDYASRREARLELFVNSVRKQHMLYLERACPHF